jgi:predicted nucleic acid-binding protein
VARVTVLDASIIIGFLDPGDGLHPACVVALTAHQRDNFVIPASVYAEILVAPCRKGSAAVAEVEAFLVDLAVTVEPVTAAIARAAARLRSRHAALRLPDALVLATADDLDATVLTGDASWTKISPRATVVRATRKR